MFFVGTQNYSDLSVFFRMLREQTVVIDCEKYHYSKQNIIVKELTNRKEEYIDYIPLLPTPPPNHPIYRLQLSCNLFSCSLTIFMVLIGYMVYTYFYPAQILRS